MSGTILRVSAAFGEQYELLTEFGAIRAELSGLLRFSASGPIDLPVTGDLVSARVIEPGHAVIVAILPRRTCISRRAPGGRHQEQPLAAKVDVAVVVTAIGGDFNSARLERYFTIFRQSAVESVIVLSKSDLCDDAAPFVHEARRLGPGTRVLACSAVSGQGLEAVRCAVGENRIAVFVGSSGAGKSSLVNALLMENRQATTPVRDSDGRGRHTTTRREWIPLGAGSAIIDTPGLREIQLWATAATVDEVFPDVESVAEGCRFRDCTHTTEPGCAVQAALESGELDSRRLASWAKLRREAQRHELLSDHIAAQSAKQRLKAIHKQARTYKQRY